MVPAATDSTLGPLEGCSASQSTAAGVGVGIDVGAGAVGLGAGAAVVRATDGAAEGGHQGPARSTMLTLRNVWPAPVPEIPAAPVA